MRAPGMCTARIALAVGLCATVATAWQGPFNITADFNPTGSNYMPDLNETSAGWLHLTWMGKKDGVWQIWHRTRDPQGIFGPVTTLAYSNDSDPFNVHSTVDAWDNLHVVWSVAGNGGYGIAGNEVFYRVRYANGTWSSAVNLSNSYARPSMAPDVAVDSLGCIFVAWHEEAIETGYWEIALAWFDGASWHPYGLVTADAALDNAVQLEMDTNDTLHLLWTTYQEVLYRTRTVAGVWSATENVSLNAGGSQGQRLAVADDGTVHAIWNDLSYHQSYEEVYKNRSGGVWSAVENLSGLNPNADCCGSLDVDNAGNVHMIWIDYMNVYYRMRTGATWQPAIGLPLSQQSVGSGNATMVDSSGSVHMIYEDTTGLYYMINNIPDLIPPDPAGSVTATGGNQSVRLSWVNPTNFDFGGTLVRAKTTGFPAHAQDGELVCNLPGSAGMTRQCDHLGLTNGTTYYYGVFTYDWSGTSGGGSPVTATPAGPADMDHDGDVDQTDFGLFQNCLSGTAIPQTDPACLDARLDGDTDVDTDDVAAFVGCASGMNVPADPYCAD